MEVTADHQTSWAPELDTSHDLFDVAAHASEITAVLNRRAGSHDSPSLYLALRSCKHLHSRLTDESERVVEHGYDAETIEDLSCHASELHALVVEEATSVDDEELYVAARSLDHLSRRLTDLVS
jgi:hypothetical protein